MLRVFQDSTEDALANYSPGPSTCPQPLARTKTPFDNMRYTSLCGTEVSCEALVFDVVKRANTSAPHSPLGRSKCTTHTPCTPRMPFVRHSHYALRKSLVRRSAKASICQALGPVTPRSGTTRCLDHSVISYDLMGQELNCEAELHQTAPGMGFYQMQVCIRVPQDKIVSQLDLRSTG